MKVIESTMTITIPAIKIDGWPFSRDEVIGAAKEIESLRFEGMTMPAPRIEPRLRAHLEKIGVLFFTRENPAWVSGPMYDAFMAGIHAIIDPPAKRIQADENAQKWQAEATAARKKGNINRALKCEMKASYWLIRLNRLEGK